MGDDEGSVSISPKNIGIAIGAVIAVAAGGYTSWKALEPVAYHAESATSASAAIVELRRDLSVLAVRTTAIETAGAVTRERFEALERLALERLERMKRAEERQEQTLDRLRVAEGVISQLQDALRGLERRRP